jgi:SAM-dependent methyltransferase
VSDFGKFELRPPRPQNAVDIFAGKWASTLSEVLPGVISAPSEVPLFVTDDRPRIAARALGKSDGRFDDMSILELGPLEGGHSYQLEHLGAREVLAVEANVEAFLKCLIVKEILRLKNVRFVLGDLMAFFAECNTRFDVIFCCGVLYHMIDPILLLHEIASHTDRVYIWTHYYLEGKTPKRSTREVERFGKKANYYSLEYGDVGQGTFWGGNTSFSCWMEKEAIIAAVKHFGFINVSVLNDNLDTTSGPFFSLAAWK